MQRRILSYLTMCIGQRSSTGERNTGSFSSSTFRDGVSGRAGSDCSLAASTGAGAGAGEVKGEGLSKRGGVVRRTPKPDAARTSSKFIGERDAEGGASWDEDFFFGRVSGEIAVRIVCIDKVCGLVGVAAARVYAGRCERFVCVCACVRGYDTYDMCVLDCLCCIILLIWYVYGQY